mmetsp:Transcript_4115/g.11319  ORF Transcript_4115/g.11319 Transcript_4115/m.11319 type:complete len:280 (-) Transcript_4115:11-850(-)
MSNRMSHVPNDDDESPRPRLPTPTRPPVLFTFISNAASLAESATSTWSTSKLTWSERPVCAEWRETLPLFFDTAKARRGAAGARSHGEEVEGALPPAAVAALGVFFPSEPAEAGRMSNSNSISVDDSLRSSPSFSSDSASSQEGPSAPATSSAAVSWVFLSLEAEDERRSNSNSTSSDDSLESSSSSSSSSSDDSASSSMQMISCSGMTAAGTVAAAVLISPSVAGVLTSPSSSDRSTTAPSSVFAPRSRRDFFFFLVGPSEGGGGGGAESSKNSMTSA